MKSRIIYLAAAALSLLSCKAALETDDFTPVLNDVDKVTVSSRNLNLIVGDARMLTAEVTPWNARDLGVYGPRSGQRKRIGHGYRPFRG